MDVTVLTSYNGDVEHLSAQQWWKRESVIKQDLDSLQVSMWGLYSPKDVVTEMVCLVTLSAIRKTLYLVLGLRLLNVCCRWSGHKDRAGKRESILYISRNIVEKKSNTLTHFSKKPLRAYFLSLCVSTAPLYIRSL